MLYFAEAFDSLCSQFDTSIIKQKAFLKLFFHHLKLYFAVLELRGLLTVIGRRLKKYNQSKNEEMN